MISKFDCYSGAEPLERIPINEVIIVKTETNIIDQYEVEIFGSNDITYKREDNGSITFCYQSNNMGVVAHVTITILDNNRIKTKTYPLIRCI